MRPSRNRFELSRRRVPSSRVRRPGLQIEALEGRILLANFPSLHPIGEIAAALASPVVGAGIDVAGTSEPVVVMTDGSNENERAMLPVQVTGSFLVGGAEPSGGDTRSMSFNDVVQGQSDTCSFSAVLSAVARTTFDLNSGITLERQVNERDAFYLVRIYKADAQGAYHPSTVEEEFNGTIFPADLRSTDAREFWTTLFISEPI